jgi:hypothetical protein
MLGFHLLLCSSFHGLSYQLTVSVCLLATRCWLNDDGSSTLLDSALCPFIFLALAHLQRHYRAQLIKVASTAAIQHVLFFTFFSFAF